LRVPQRWPERQNEAERLWLREELERLHQDPKGGDLVRRRVWREGDPRPRRRWSARGSRLQVPYLGEHVRTNVVGAVRPKTGQRFALLLDGVDTDAFQCFLDRWAEAIPPTLTTGASSSSITPPGKEPAASAGIISKLRSSPLTARTSIPSNASGCVSKPTT